jgi:hypothetical protein
MINVPGLEIEPKEKGGEVTIQCNLKPCIVVDVGEGNSVTIKNTKMILKGNENQKIQKRSLESKKKAPQRVDEHPAIANLQVEDKDSTRDGEIVCIVHIISGTLNLVGCNLSVESLHKNILNSKVLCLV